ncbi:phosphopantetheine-binding protein, partial [Streptomyces sp. NPDC021224]|uniref:phosphopantetheine-binding protein n=1 Tax=Streptomyces sp. NPDC021224 TaxID=3365120 RepID=UPI003789D6EC
PDGHLEYLGRLDDQIKLRGHRIEPGEIETHLQGRGAVAIHNNTLVAYTAGPPDDLPATLHKTLPPHLVPTLWIELDTLPLTPGGKLDRKALPAPTHTRDTTTPPRTDAETLVADIYADILDTHPIGAHDDFFTLGGHSLLAVKTIARIRTATDIDLPLRTLFDHRTVEAVAQALENALLTELDQLTDAEADQLLAEGP